MMTVSCRPMRVSTHHRVASAAILLLYCSWTTAQEHDTPVNGWSGHLSSAEDQATSSPSHISSSYSSLTEELAAHQHSRFTVQLKPGHDLLEIILALLDWKEQDVDQVWIRPGQHVDSDRYNTETPSGMEAALLTFMRKARISTDDEAVLQFTNPRQPEEQQTKQAVLDTLQELRRSGQILTHNGVNSISWRVPGEYKMDLNGDINVMRKPLLLALQQSPGIEYAHMDEHYIRKHHPAWYDVSAEPWEI